MIVYQITMNLYQILFYIYILIIIKFASHTIYIIQFIVFEYLFLYTLLLLLYINKISRKDQKQIYVYIIYKKKTV